jgi:hypothetical protein
MDAGEAIYMWIGRSVNDNFLQLVFDCKSFNELPDHSVGQFAKARTVYWGLVVGSWVTPWPKTKIKIILGLDLNLNFIHFGIEIN